MNAENNRLNLKGYKMRRARSADIDAVLFLDRDHMKAHVERHYPGMWDESNARTIIEENIERVRIVEFAGCIVASYYWWVDPPDMGILHSMQVVVEHRSRGIGTWLLACFESEVRARGFRKVGLAVFTDNPAKRLYERHGYIVTGTDGPNALQMEKTL